MRALDLFAGCGGWDVACAALGIAVDGVEVMPEARATRDAAGMSTIWDDVWTFGQGPAVMHGYDGLIASPPCQTFSMAGKGSGRAALDAVLGLVAGRSWEDLNGLRGAVDSHGWDERTGLVLVPLAYWHAMRPQWVALEQVPAVLPVWEATAGVMREAGYSVWTGYLTSEMYGVPQTRKRAVLMARRSDCIAGSSCDECAVSPPSPTHSRYYPRDRARLDPGVPKWVSMAEALGWDAMTMRSNYGTGGDPANRGERASDEPSPTVTSKVDRNRVEFVNGNQAHSARRDLAEPAPTVHFAQRQRVVEWQEPDPKSSVRVSVDEAACLQSFPPGFPLQGTKTKQYLQIGNAIPPRLALAILKELV